MAGEDEEIVVRARLEDALSRPVDRATRAIDDLGDQAAETSTQLIILESAERQVAAGARDLSRDSGRSREEIEELGKSSRTAAKDHDEQTSALDRLGRILNRVKGKSKGFDLSKIIGLYKIPAIVTAVNLLAGALMALGGAAYAGVAGLAPLIGLMGALPGVLLAAGASLGAVKLGMFGVSDATEALISGDIDKITETMKELTPAGRELARTLADLAKGPLKTFKRGLQTAIAPGFTAALERVPSILKGITPELEGTGRAIGHLADQSSRVADSPLFQKRLGAVMRTNNTAIANGGRAGLQLAQAGLGIAYAFRPVLRIMSEYLLMGSRFIRTQIDAGIASGALTEFFRRSWRLAKSVGQVLEDLSVALYNVGTASGVLGDDMGRGLAGAAAAFRDWSGSVEGQQKLHKFFSDLVPVMREIGKLALALGGLLGGLSTNADLAPLLAQIRTQLVPALAELSSAVSGAFGEAMISAATAFAEFNSALTFSPLATVLQGIADAVIFLSEGISAAPYPINTALSSLLVFSVGLKAASGGVRVLTKTFSPLTTGIKQVHSGLSDTKDTVGLLGKTAAGSKSKLQQFRNGLNGVAESQSAFATRTTKAGVATTKMIEGLKGAPKALMGMRFIGPMLTGIGTAARVMWLAITGPIGLTIIAILAVVAIGVLLYKKWKPFRDLVDTVWAGIVAGAKWAFGYLQVAFKVWWAFVQIIFKAFVIYYKVLWAIVSTVAKIAFAVLSTLFLLWWNYYAKPILTMLWTLAKTVFNGIVAVARAWWSAVRAIWAALLPFVRPIWQAILAVARTVMNLVRAVVASVLGVARGLWRGFSGAVSAVWDAIAGFVQSGMGRARDYVTSGVRKIRSAWDGIKSFIEGIWGGVADAARSAMSGVSGAINDVIGAVNSAIRAFNKLPGGDIPTIPMLYAGGPTKAGMRAMVGEIGPELWVKRGGGTEIVGKRGPEVRNFSASGYVLPNAVYEASRKTSESLPTGILRQLSEAQEASKPIPRPQPRTERTPTVLDVKIYPQTEFDMVHALMELKRQLDEEEERKINHGGWED